MAANGNNQSLAPNDSTEVEILGRKNECLMLKVEDIRHSKNIMALELKKRKKLIYKLQKEQKLLKQQVKVKREPHDPNLVVVIDSGDESGDEPSASVSMQQNDPEEDVTIVSDDDSSSATPSTSRLIEPSTLTLAEQRAAKQLEVAQRLGEKNTATRRLAESRAALDAIGSEIGIYNEECVHCHRLFRSKQNLRYHIVSQHFVKLECTAPGCTFETGHKYNLKAHLQSHRVQDSNVVRQLELLRHLKCDYVNLRYVGYFESF